MKAARSTYRLSTDAGGGMGLTKKQVASFDEATLRRSVLIPLFRAMKFRDVYHYHGGAQEQGKDIVMWKAEDFRPRVNYGVVAKATRITGRAQGKSSAAEVHFQIMQCLGDPYQDPRTTDRHRVDRCLVVSNREISKESIISISSALAKTSYGQQVDFIDGDKLWELIEEFWPDQTVIDHLSQAREALENASEHHRITASTTAGGISFGIEPKHDGAGDVEPLAFSGRFEFPDTQEGRAALEKLQEHIRSGAPVEIDGSFVKDLQLPDLISRYIVPETDEVGKVVIGPRQIARPIRARIELTSADGAVVSLDALEFRAVQVGMDEITLNNHQQSVPWRFQLNLKFRAKVLHLTVKLDTTGLAVKRELETARLVHALATGADFALYSEDTGLLLGRGSLPAGQFSPPAPEYVALLEKLMAIQEKLGVAFFMPDRAITAEEANATYEIAEKVSSGSVTANVNAVSITIHPEAMATAVETFADGKTPFLTWIGRETHELFGVHLDLGPVVISTDCLGIPPEIWTELQDNVERQAFAEGFAVRLVPLKEPCRATLRYVNWLPESERSGLEVAFPELRSEELAQERGEAIVLPTAQQAVQLGREEAPN